MAWDLNAATIYIRANTLDNEDFLDADDERKEALLNVSKRTIDRKLSAYEVPNEAYYIFAASLGAIFNDTNRMFQQGIASFAVKGISFTAKDGIGSKNGAPVDLAGFIPKEVYEMAGAPTGRTIKTTVIG
jgi:hypothetical protein